MSKVVGSILLVVCSLVLVPTAVQAALDLDPPDVGIDMPVTAPPTVSTVADEPVTPTSWQDCSSCHERPGHNHAGECQWCHVEDESVEQTQHPVFEPINDGTCIGCHQAGSLP